MTLSGVKFAFKDDYGICCFYRDCRKHILRSERSEYT